MKNGWAHTLVASLLGLVCLSCTPSSRSTQDLVVVQIADEQIKSKDFARELLYRLKSFDLVSGQSEDFIEQAKKAVVQEFVHSHIVRKWAEQHGIQVSKQELDGEFQSIRSQYPDDISFREAFADENMAMEYWLKKLRIKLLEKKVQEKLTAEVTPPSEEEIKAFYSENLARYRQLEAIQIRQIVTENQLEAERLRKLIRKGSDFEELAKKYSISPDAELGGKSDWITRGAAEIFDQLFEQKPNFISEPMESPFGHHIIQLLAKRPARQLPLTEVKAQIKKELFEDRKQATYTSWIDQRVKSLKLLIHEQALAAIKIDVKIQ